MENKNFGFLAINKPTGLTSHDCVNKLRKILGIKRIGHGGTLDPAVTGVLPIAIGNATRLLSFLPLSKKYEGIIQLGLRTNTNDLEGEILTKQNWPNLSKEHIEKYLQDFRGEIEQSPPLFSSVHIKGERAHTKARRGEIFELKSKQIIIHKIKLLDWNKELGKISLSIHCSSGTYIRALARDIGERIGCGGALDKLCRTEALGFNLKETISLDDLTSVRTSIINPIKVLTHLPNIQLKTEHEISCWSKGQALYVPESRVNQPSSSTKIELNNINRSILVTIENDLLIGIANYDEKSFLIHPKIVFNAAG